MTRYLKNFGDWGEQQACNFLLRQRFQVIERNFYTTTGEIDIIAKKGDDYYFVEVKTRLDFNLANDSAITHFKKIKFQKAIRAYCYKRNIGEVGIISAGLIVFVNKLKHLVKFRFFVWS